MSVISNWIEALNTTNLSEGVEPDPVSRWLIITRASVLPMTFFSAAIGGLLALPGGGTNFGLWALCTLGLLLAHASNNLINDYFDLQSGFDTPDSARARYAPHPVLSGMLSQRSLVQAIAIVTASAAAIGLALAVARGWTAVGFALAGFAISLFYVAPPIHLKRRGLGEPSVFVVWGPLMIAGTHFVTSGENPVWVWWASIPYGLLVTTVLFGKHIDKHDSDRAKGIRTLPVILGPDLARRVAQGLVIGFHATVVLEVIVGILGVWTLAVLVSVPTAIHVLRAYSQPRPTEKPKDFPIWPLWYVAWAFWLTRQTGALFTAALVINAFWPVFL
jgi:1,4-dihydroxy-2-naphthoate octaprenyltransferase